MKRYKLKNYQFVFIPKWKIEGYDNYYFTVDKVLFNSGTNRASKQVVRNCSRGYNLNGKFITLKKLKPLLLKIENKSKNIFDYIN